MARARATKKGGKAKESKPEAEGADKPAEESSSTAPAKKTPLKRGRKPGGKAKGKKAKASPCVSSHMLYVLI